MFGILVHNDVCAQSVIDTIGTGVEYKIYKINSTHPLNTLAVNAVKDSCTHLYYLAECTKCMFGCTGWGKILLNRSPKNGIIGLADLSSTCVLTQVCVSMSHLQKFGYFSPPELYHSSILNWFMEVYKNTHFEIIQDCTICTDCVNTAAPQALVKMGKKVLNGAAELYTPSIPVYILNLTRNLERRLHMSNEAREKGIDLTFLTAINGWRHPLAEKFTCCNRHPERVPDFIRPQMDYVQVQVGEQWYLFNSNLTKGEVGLAISTLMIYNQMIQKNVPWMLILEDDVVLRTDFKSHLQTIEGDLATLDSLNVDFVYLNDKMEPLGSEGIINNRYTPIKRGCCFSGYLISARGAAKLLDIFNPLIFPIDLQSTAHASVYDTHPEYRYREFNKCKYTARINMYKYYTTLVTQSTDFKSSIHGHCPYHALI